MTKFTKTLFFILFSFFILLPAGWADWGQVNIVISPEARAGPFNGSNRV